MSGCSRQSKQGQPSELLDPAEQLVPAKKAKKLATRVSRRNINNCIEFVIMNDLICGACQKYVRIPPKEKSRSKFQEDQFS